jgi:hypothetical protein
VYEFWTARQRAGKTFALRARAVDLARHPSVLSVWILDRLGEWYPHELPLASCVVCSDLPALLRASEMPRCVIFRLGQDPHAYTSILKAAADLGDVCVVIDEAYDFAPSGARFTGSDELRAIVLAGAHLPRAEDGEMRPVHLLVAAQYPKSVHHLLWSQAYTVIVGVSSGDNTFEWLRSNFSTPDYDAVVAVASLPLYSWECVRGEMPHLPKK